MIFIFSSCSEDKKTLGKVFEFKLVTNASYRCYGGYDGVKKFDIRTGKVCDNKDYNKKIINKSFKVKLVEEKLKGSTTPSLGGSWHEKVEFHGRVYSIGITVWKNIAENKYSARLYALDDEVVSRKTESFISMKRMSDMNPITLVYSSAGQKEEISYYSHLEVVK